jgi:ATP-dependent helicase YprA (DUF1998 family)
MSKVDEIEHVIRRLKQRFGSDELGSPLVDRVLQISRKKHKPDYGRVSSDQLKGDVKKIVEIAGLKSLAGYQHVGMQAILEGKSLILSAPTSFGKTEVFLLPLLYRSIVDEFTTIILYPRIELAKSQFRRTLKYIPAFEKALGKTAVIGIQFSGIASSLEYTIGANERLSPTSLTELRHPFDNELVTLEWKNLDSDKVILKLAECPNCNVGLTSNAFYRTSGNARSEFVGLAEYKGEHNFKCPSCEAMFAISLSKEEHIKKIPNVLISTIDSFDNLLLHPMFDELWTKTRVLVVDEIHAYYSLYGAHTSQIIKRAREKIGKLSGKDVQFIGASATIDDPGRFGRKFFGVSNIAVIEPDSSDRLESRAMEHYFFIQSRDRPGTLSTYLQTAMLVGHSILPPRKRSISFFDSLDILYRAHQQLLDADTDKELWKFRTNPADKINDRMYPCKFFPDDKNCKFDKCQTFQDGECWWALAQKIMGWSPLTNPLRLDSVSSFDRGYSSYARIVHATSVLELGIDDPDILSVFQYKAPKTVFSFIQRVGRGGRLINDDNYIFVIMGKDISDSFYFKRADKIISGNFLLPLNTENPIIRKIHNNLEETGGRVVKNFDFLKTTKQEEFERMYRLWCESAWEGFFDASELLPFKLFLQMKLGQNFILEISQHREKKKEYMRKIDEIIHEERQNINRIIEPYKTVGAKREPIEVISSLIELLESTLEMIKTTQVAEQCKQAIKLMTEKIKPEVWAGKDVSNLLQQLEELLANFSSNLIKEKPRPEMFDIGKKMVTYVDFLKEITQKGKPDISSDQVIVRRCKYRVAMYDKVKSAMYYWDSASIIKDLWRAYYYYCRAEDIDVQQPRLPDNYFSDTKTVDLDIDGKLEETEAINLLYTYIPWKTVFRPERTSTVLLTPSIENIEKEKEDYFMIEVSAGGQKGLNSKGRVTLEPFTLALEKMSLDPEGSGVVRWCEKCNRIYSPGKHCCERDGQKLKYAKTYSEPIVTRDYKISVKDSKPEILDQTCRLKLANLISEIELVGVDVTVYTFWWDKNKIRFNPTGKSYEFRANLVTPLGFETETRGILFTPPLLKELFNKEAEESLSSRGINPEEIYLHSLAHFLLRIVSSVSGVNPDDLWYAYKTEDNTIAIFERYQGGAGIVDTFFEILETNPARIYSEIKRSLSCPVKDGELVFIGRKKEDLSDEAVEELNRHEKSQDPETKKNVMRKTYKIVEKGTIISDMAALKEMVSNELNLDQRTVDENFPDHSFDNCQECLKVPYCSVGPHEQWRHLSLQLVEKAISLLIKKVSPDDAADVLLDKTKGSVVGISDDKFEILQL